MKGLNERGQIMRGPLPLLVVLTLSMSLVLAACGVETPTNPPTPAPPTVPAAATAPVDTAPTATTAAATAPVDTAPTATTAAATAPVDTAPTATTAAGTGTGAVIEVTLNEWSIEPKTIDATGGMVSFKVTNKGKFPHNFVVISNGQAVKKTKNLPGGQAETIEVDLSAGAYQSICDIPGHREQGMVGTLTVK